MRHRAVVFSLVVAGLFAAHPASAQPAGVGFKGFLAVDIEHFQATQTFSAVFNKSTLPGFGGGAEVSRLWKGLFVRGGVSRMQATGSRVFVFNGQVFNLNEPLTLTMTPIEVSAGWRALDRGSLQPYFGVGLLIQKYTEHSSFEDPSEAVVQTNHGLLVFGGASVPFGRHVSAMAELQYRSLPKALGQSGVSSDFKETNLGGVVIRLLLAVGR